MKVPDTKYSFWSLALVGTVGLLALLKKAVEMEELADDISA